MTATLRRFARSVVTKDVPGERLLINLETVESGTGRLLEDALVKASEAGQNLAAEPGDVLFAKLRPYLRKSLLVAQPVFASGEFLCLRPNREVLDSRWLFHVTQSEPWLERSMASAYGAKMPRTSWDEMADFVLNPPDLDTQRRVADFLDDQVRRIDEVIRLRQQQVHDLAERSALEADNAVRTLSAAHGFVRLKFQAELITVGIVVTPSKWYADSGVPALRGTNVKPGVISLDDLVHLSDEGHALHQKSALRAGDVVVVRTGAAGAAAVVPAELDGINAIDILIVRPKAHLLDSHYLAMCLNSPAVADLTAATVVGAIQGHINVGTLRDVLVPHAPLAEQRRVTRAWQADAALLEEARVHMQAQVLLLQERKRSLITAAVTGELDVPTARGVA